MAGHPIRQAVAVLAAAALTATLVSSALAADPEVAAGKPAAKCDGKVATKVGTPGNDTLVGTPKRDIIAGLGGNDVIYGLGGNDVLCGGSGHDRLFGGPGRDKLLGQTGRDRLRGGTARDRLFGGAHADRLFGQGGPDLLLGGPGNDRLVGGAGIDTCYQNSGQGPLLQCELPAAAPVVPAPVIVPAPPPEPPALVVAYSDLNGNPGYQDGSADVMINKILDVDMDGKVSPNDTIIMGQYPTSVTPTAMDFASWGVERHTVASVTLRIMDGLVVTTTSGGELRWSYGSSIAEVYSEGEDPDSSHLRDSILSSFTDDIRMAPSSPSKPDATPPSSASDDDNNDFLDLDFYYTPS